MIMDILFKILCTYEIRFIAHFINLKNLLLWCLYPHGPLTAALTLPSPAYFFSPFLPFYSFTSILVSLWASIFFSTSVRSDNALHHNIIFLSFVFLSPSELIRQSFIRRLDILPCFLRFLCGKGASWWWGNIKVL